MSPRRWSINGLASMSLLALLGCVAQGRSAPASAQTRIEELERENAALRLDIAALVDRLQHLEDRTDLWGQPTVEGVILEIDPDLRLAILSTGRKDGVKVGYVFDVYLQAQYKGQVRVQDVQESTCSAAIVHEMNSMAKGDSATTSL